MTFQEFAKEKCINIKSVSVSDHAIYRAKERLKYSNTLKREQIAGNLKTLLGRSKYIGESMDEEGNEGFMFAVEGKSIYLSLDLQVITTVIVHEKLTYEPIKLKTIELHKKEIRKLDRTIKTKERKLRHFLDDCNVEKAMLSRRMNRTRSNSVKFQCREEIKMIDNSIEELETEIKSIKDEKRRIAKSMVSLI